MLHAHLSCVGSSDGHLTQDLTVDSVSIYPKGDSGTKTQEERIPSPMSWWIWRIPDTERAAHRIPKDLELESHI